MIKKLIGVVLVAVCGLGPSGWASDTQRDGTTVVFLVRHAEKESGSDPVLTEAGQQRAANLEWILRNEPLDAILSTPFRRTLQTAEPISTARGLQPIVTPIEGSAAEFVNELAEKILRDHRGQRILVVGHSNTVPETIDALGAAGTPRLTEQDYDDLFILTLQPGHDPVVVRLKYSSRALGSGAIDGGVEDGAKGAAAQP